jgi:DNA-binding GntR family transcriptional regulator
MSRKSNLTQRTKKDVMVEILRDAILSGELQPGERLPQEELAERFKVSATPIREAIQQLIAEGVLSHSPYRGVQVAEVKVEDVREVYLIRGVVERLATREGVLNLKISDVRRLHGLQEELIVYVRQGEGVFSDRSPILRINRDFHMLIYSAAALPQLEQIIKTLWIKSPWDSLFVVPNRAHMVVIEHQRILDAIDRGDAEEAGQAMQEHIEKGAIALANFLKKD